ncbi:MAG TPA: type III-B CRISPR module RAMP protein Cmr6, partial [Deltaproteobacteria bacterium]|nr:type III-B CRISPR module RAMP protein Cmr6 [Deltaproteobacteria bacterium]
DENDQMISSLFGNQEKRGSVIFMDAYPENIPDLHVDIMNPHYGEYYSDDKNKIPPADYLDPTPIKFLTVQKGTVFIFRSLVRNDVADLADEVKKAYVRALTEEGIGAKTSLGYGLFTDLSYEEAACVTEFEKEEKIRKQKEEMEARAKAEQERLASMTEDEKMLERINKLGKEGSEISAVLNECLSGDFDRSVYQALKERLIDFGEWKPYGSKQKKAKMRKRKAEIEAKIEGK